jgi:actin-related protein
MYITDPWFYGKTYLQAWLLFFIFHRAAELMFEKYKVPALFLAKNAVCLSQK